MALLARRFDRVGLVVAATSCGLMFLTLSTRMALAGSARDYLNAPIDTWLNILQLWLLDVGNARGRHGRDVERSF
jgi:hypothetical protein